MRISPESFDHALGSIFPLVVTFNMALVHHLSGIECHKDKERRRKLQKSLKLYELAYRWQMEEEIDSLAFTMIIANNLSEIHRIAKNEQKHHKCLQNLLSTMMYVVIADYDREIFGEMDGFFLNTTPLILQGGCAGAA